MKLTTAVFESYFPEREDASKFLKMINTWWLICNSKEMSHPNPLGNAVRVGDGKTDFLEALADWLEKWHDDLSSLYANIKDVICVGIDTSC